MPIETPQYKLIKKKGNFEIRSYDEMVVARTSVNSDYKESTLTEISGIVISRVTDIDTVVF